MSEARRQRQEESWRIALVDFGVVRRVALAMAHEQLARAGPDGRLYQDPDMLRMVEAGLVIAYMRPFMSSKPDGVVPAYSQLPRKIVPVEHRELHDLLNTRRDKYVAHTGAVAPPLRRVELLDAGWFSVDEPSPLTRLQLIELADLAQKLVTILHGRLGQSVP